MTNSIVQDSQIQVSTIGDELVVDSRLIATQLGIQHETTIKTIRKYATDFQSMGNLRFEIGTSAPNSNGAVHQVNFCYLNEVQSSFLMTLSKNTEQVVKCKKDLVVAFNQAKSIIREVIPAQNERLIELQMALEIERSINKRMELQDCRIALHGLSTALLLEGKGDAVISVDRPTLEVIDQRNNTRYEGQTLVQLQKYLNANHGTSFKTGAELGRWLKQNNLSHLIAQTPRSILQDYIPMESLPQIYHAIGSRTHQQRLIGQ